MLRNKQILVIDDTPSILSFLQVSLEVLGAKFYKAQTASYGLALCEQLHPDVVILDLGLPDKEGLNILPALKRIQAHSPAHPPIVIVLTVRNEAKYYEMAMDMGADAYLTKPFNVEELIDLIQQKLGPPPTGHLKLVSNG